MKMSVKKILKENQLIINSVNLMLSTAVTAGFGFIFWIIIAHIFTSETVGIATTLLSLSSLLSLLGLAGFDTIFVRFLAKSRQQNEQINSGLIISGLASAIISGIFCLLIPILSPKLEFVLYNPWYLTAFIVFTIFTTWNILTNAIFIAYRRTSFVFVINLCFSIIKICLPLVIHIGGSMTIFTIVGIAQVVNVLLSILVLRKYFHYIPSIKINFAIVHETRHFGSSMYIANFLNLLPDSVLPIIIIDKLGSIQEAYFYVAFAIANIVYTIAFATNQVLVAEAAHDEEHFMQHARKGLIFVLGLLTLAIVFVIIFCPFVLNLFGYNYSNGATSILRILCISGFAVMIYSYLSFIFKHNKNLQAIILMTSANAIAIIGLSLLWAKPYGLIGIGWAWLIGTVIAVLVGLTKLLFPRLLFHKIIYILKNNSCFMFAQVKEIK